MIGLETYHVSFKKNCSNKEQLRIGFNSVPGGCECRRWFSDRSEMLLGVSGRRRWGGCDENKCDGRW